MNDDYARGEIVRLRADLDRLRIHLAHVEDEARRAGYEAEDARRRADAANNEIERLRYR